MLLSKGGFLFPAGEDGRQISRVGFSVPEGVCIDTESASVTEHGLSLYAPEEDVHIEVGLYRELALGDAPAEKKEVKAAGMTGHLYEAAYEKRTEADFVFDVSGYGMAGDEKNPLCILEVLAYSSAGTDPKKSAAVLAMLKGITVEQ